MTTGTGDREDDASISDESRMLRRIPPSWINEFRPDSSNFLEKDADEGLSVTIWHGADDLRAVVDEQPNFGVVRVLASELRAAGYKLVRAPLAHNPNHCECYGAPGKGLRRVLAKAAVWVLPPAPHDPAPYGHLDAL